jgi:hypothetical protein
VEHTRFIVGLKRERQAVCCVNLDSIRWWRGESSPAEEKLGHPWMCLRTPSIGEIGLRFELAAAAVKFHGIGRVGP